MGHLDIVVAVQDSARNDSYIKTNAYYNTFENIVDFY